MARAAAGLPAGVRVSDHISLGVIARTFPLEEIVEAHRYLESNQQFGKIVVTVA